MKHAVLSFVCIICAIFTLPHFIPQLNQHAFALGDISIRWCHLIALGLVALVFRGGK